MLQDKLYHHPLAFAAGLLVWLPIAVWTITLVNWMVTAEIEVWSGVLGICIAIGMGIETMNPPKEEYAPFMFAGVCLSVILFPFIRAAANKRELALADCESMERAYEMLEKTPNNLGAKFKLARLAYVRGMFGHATAIAEEALQGVPKRGFEEEFAMVSKWKQTTPPEMYRPIPCVECGAMNPPGSLHCVSCGARFLLDHARGRFIGANTGKRLLAVWSVMMLALVAVPILSGSLPKTASATVVAVMAVAVGLVMWYALKPADSRAAA